MKSILLSIKPEYVAKILNGEKTIEIRKHAIPVGTKVYIYCTKGGYIYYSNHLKEYIFTNKLEKKYDHSDCKFINGKVVASFVIDNVSTVKQIQNYNEFSCEDDHSTGILDKSYLTKYGRITVEELSKYANKKPAYLWHISQLKIFDKPKEIYDFNSINGFIHCDKCPFDIKTCDQKHCNCIYKAPQSYCYVEELKDEI